jgi:glycerol-3-phosphate O-acyltransferase
MKSVIQSLKNKIGEYYSGSLYERQKSLILWLFEKILARVQIAEEYVDELKNLSRKGIVVYALKNKSQLNSLILWHLSARVGISQPVYCHGISMIFWQPFTIAFKVLFSRFFYNPYRNKFLQRTTEEKKSSIIYLRGSEFIRSKYIKDPLIELIDAQKKLDVPIYLVPQLVAYGRRREKKDKTLVDLLFGETENPGTLRRLINFFRFSKRAFVISSEPINLAEFIEKKSGTALFPETMSYLLRRRLIEIIDEEKRTIVGPVLKSREEIIEMCLRDVELVRFMEELAASEGKSYDQIVKQSKKYLFEIATDYNEVYIGIWEKLLTWLWNDIYDGVVVDKEGLARMRSVSKKMPFVVVPCHRSHIDYLFLSYVFYHYNIQLPFIAAGTNLMFWPMGHVFRKSGAFFLRRTFRNDILYGKVFSQYMKILLQEGFPIEFFIEGGRSRTGKMVMPKYGLLSMVIQAYREGACDDLAIIPAYIGYDRVIEEKAYLKEIGGAKKEKEKTSTLIKSRKVLKKRYGSVYLNIGEPLLLKSYLASLEVPFQEMSMSERQGFYRKIGYEIVGEINKISVVSPFSLLAAGFLSHYKRGISHDDLMTILDEFYDYLTYKKVKFSSTFAYKEKALTDALNRFESLGHISKMGPEEDEEEELGEIIYSVEDDKRMNLEYYKNNVLHFFVPLSFVATSILSATEDEIPLSKIMEDYRFFKRLFRHEFIFDDDVDDLEEVNDVLSYIHDRGLIVGHETGNDAWIEVKGKGRTNLVPFGGLIHNYIESYWITMRSSLYLKNKKKQEKELVKNIQKLGIKMYKKGEISKAEALSRLNYLNAIKFLTDSDILVITKDEDEKKKDVKTYSLADDKNLIESLRHKLFKLMT